MEGVSLSVCLSAITLSPSNPSWGSDWPFWGPVLIPHPAREKGHVIPVWQVPLWCGVQWNGSWSSPNDPFQLPFIYLFISLLKPDFDFNLVTRIWFLWTFLGSEQGFDWLNPISGPLVIMTHGNILGLSGISEHLICAVWFGGRQEVSSNEACLAPASLFMIWGAAEKINIIKKISQASIPGDCFTWVHNEC